MNHRSMRAVALLSGAVLTAGLVAGCGGSGADTDTGTAASARAAAPDAVAAAYTTTVQAGSAKVEFTVSGKSGTALSASGGVDFDDGSAELSVQLPNDMGELEVRYLGGTAYAKLPPSLAGLLGGGQPWVSVDVGTLAKQHLGASLEQLQDSLSTNPAQLLAYLRGTGQQVRELGPATVGGVPTTHYAVTIDLDTAAADLPEPVREGMSRIEKRLGTHELPAELWIDEQGRVRKLVLALQLPQPATGSPRAGSASPEAATTEHITVTLSDYGAPVDVAAPPASQTRDLTALLGGH